MGITYLENYRKCDPAPRALFCSVLEFGPVPTSPMPLLQGAPVRLLAILLVSQHGVRLYVLGSCAVRLPLTVGQVVGGVTVA